MESKVTIGDRIEADQHVGHEASQTAIASRVQESPRRLWVALVEHEMVPGTRAVLFYQSYEPADDAIFGRFSEDASPDSLSITGLYDLAHAAEVDQLSQVALDDFARGFCVHGIDDAMMTTVTPRGGIGLQEEAPRWFVGELDHTWSWNEDGRMEVKCRVVVDVANERLVAAQVWGYKSWCEADSDQNDDLAKSLFVENKVGEAPGAFDLFEIDRLPEWAATAAGDQEMPPYEDDEVIGLTNDGCVMRWDSDNGMPANSGESLEEFGVHNLREQELGRVGVAREAWEAAVAEQGNVGDSVLVIGTREDRNTILAALRFYQQHGMGEPFNRSDAIHDIATNGDEDCSYDDGDIDDLCERVNLAPARLPRRTHSRINDALEEARLPPAPDQSRE